jgi:hypothetical protein
VAFRGALHLDEPFRVVHHDVHVRLGLGVFRVVEVQDRDAVDDSDRQRRDLPVNRIALELARPDEMMGGKRQCDIAPRDRGGARAAVGLEHVAIDRDGAFAERASVDDGPQAAADQALDLQRPAALLPSCGFTRRPRMRRARQHPVLRGDPALTLALQERRNLRLEGGRAKHAGVAKLHQHAAFRMAREVRRELHAA